eukprot:2667988-Amphidinium_carterae.1
MDVRMSECENVRQEQKTIVLRVCVFPSQEEILVNKPPGNYAVAVRVERPLSMPILVCGNTIYIARGE